jgi:hypothetical protein
MKLTGWQLVAVIFAGLGAFVALALFGRDTGTFIGGALAILGAFGYTAREMSSAKQDLAAVKVQTNGNNSELTSLLRESHSTVKELAGLLASMSPSPQVIDGTVVDDPRPASPAR